jgi:hypothetical protein
MYTIKDNIDRRVWRRKKMGAIEIVTRDTTVTTVKHPEC